MLRGPIEHLPQVRRPRQRPRAEPRGSGCSGRPGGFELAPHQARDPIGEAVQVASMAPTSRDDRPGNPIDGVPVDEGVAPHDDGACMGTPAASTACLAP
jgi:hypothetical protein